MIEKMIYLPILLLIISNIFFATKYFKRKRRKRIMRVYGERTSKIKEPFNEITATSQKNFHLIGNMEKQCKNAVESAENRIDNLEDTIIKALAISNDRLDKLGVDVAFSNDRLDKLEVDVTFMKDFTIKKKASQLRKNIKESLDNKQNKKTFKPKKKPRKQKKRMFTDKEIDQEIRAELGTILFLSPQQMATQQTKAYRRLWYKANKNKNK